MFARIADLARLLLFLKHAKPRRLCKRAGHKPKQLGGMGMKKQGFTLVEIMIVVAIIGLLAAIAIPSFVKARNTSQQNACINNLRQIDSGKEQAAMANNWGNDVDCTSGDNFIAVNDYIKGGLPTCPASGTYTYGTLTNSPQCSVNSTNGATDHQFGTD
jgi:prepilin-type N-terminal cleavage/methylation domain-containing protein